MFTTTKTTAIGMSRCCCLIYSVSRNDRLMSRTSNPHEISCPSLPIHQKDLTPTVSCHLGTSDLTASLRLPSFIFFAPVRLLLSTRIAAAVRRSAQSFRIQRQKSNRRAQQRANQTGAWIMRARTETAIATVTPSQLAAGNARQLLPDATAGLVRLPFTSNYTRNRASRIASTKAA